MSRFYCGLITDMRGIIGLMYINIEGIGRELRLVMVREDGTYIQTRIMQHYSSIIHSEPETRLLISIQGPDL